MVKRVKRTQMQTQEVMKYLNCQMLLDGGGERKRCSEYFKERLGVGVSGKLALLLWVSMRGC